MKLTAFFREQLGLSQEMMAQYLGVAKSQLSMHESGKRELPTAALTKLAALAVFFDQNKVSEEHESEVQKEQELKLKAFLAIQIKDLEYKQIREQRLLENIQKKYKQNLKLYAFAQHSINNNMSLANALLQQAITGIKQHSLANQTQQLLKLESIKSQLDYINSLK
jgi:transcriptional regulator with XRE-family HTH domain